MLGGCSFEIWLYLYERVETLVAESVESYWRTTRTFWTDNTVRAEVVEEDPLLLRYHLLSAYEAKIVGAR